MSAREEQQKSDECCKEANATWEALVKQLQDDHAKCQKETEEEQVCRDAEMEKKCVQQEEQHAKQQQRLHISQSSAQSTALYNYSGYP